MTRETVVHQTIVEFLLHALPTSAILHHSPNEGRHHVAHRLRLKKMGLRPGWPDLEVCYQGTIFFLEIKTPEGRVTPVQKALHTELEAQGFSVTLLRSVDDAQAWLVSQFAPTFRPVVPLLQEDEAHA